MYRGNATGKLDILIDFEAISRPFSLDLKLAAVDHPYAYTLAIINKNNKYKSCTKIIISRHKVFKKMKVAIIKDIRFLIHEPSFEVNAETVEFIGWNPHLEGKILEHCFPGIKVSNINKFDNQSLSKLAQTHFPSKSYYTYFLPLISTHPLLVKLLSIRNFNDGLIAAIAGYTLFCLKYNITKGEFLTTSDVSFSQLSSEIKVYSQDDVKKMELYYRYPGILYQQASHVHYRQSIFKINNILMNNFNKISNFQDKLHKAKTAAERESVLKDIAHAESKQKELLESLDNLNKEANRL